jgi:hypothetical protein
LLPPSPERGPVHLLKRLSSQRALSKSGNRFASDRAPLIRRAHDLIAKPPTLWRIMRVPFTGLLLRRSWPIKFEGQFKVRDERDVNARFAPPPEKSEKCLWHRQKSKTVKFDLPCVFVDR